jgi:hypothetical protein
MSAQLNRRSFIGLASGAAIGASTGAITAGAQSTYVLTADVVAVQYGFALAVTFQVPPSSQLRFIQIAEIDSPNLFFTWDNIDVPDTYGTVENYFGPFDLPYGPAYQVTIVDESGDQIPDTPAVQVYTPQFPEASF